MPLVSSIAERDVLIFDLDNTLYPASCRLFDQVDRKMTEYVANLLDLDIEAARKLQKQYFYDHGTTLQGLLKNHKVDAEEFLNYVHDIDASPIPPNVRLVNFLANYPGQKVIFTNGCRNHMQNILTHMEMEHLFHGSFDIIDAGYLPKPNKSIYDQMLKKLNINPKRAIMFEDIPRNLEPAAALGIATVLIKVEHDEYKYLGSPSGHQDFVDYETDCLTTWLEENIVTGS